MANKIATFDFETDPFLYGRIPEPFVAGFYSADIGFKEFWGDDCAKMLVDFLADLKEPHTIYAHNGGKFDFFMMLKYLENPIKIISGRIVKCKIGIHTLQDSYAIIPIALKVFDKDDIDYRKLESDVRDKHKPEILRYLKKDCTSLYTLVSKFNERFGPRLTIGGTAIKKLIEYHPFKKTKETHDLKFRPWYFGGRVETFETGILKDEWVIYDVNSMYPHVMRNFQHPTGNRYLSTFSGILDKRGNISGLNGAQLYFARIHCKQKNVFPLRVKGESLNFSIPEGEFLVTSHELKAALKRGLVSDVKVIEAHAPVETISFPDFVDVYSAEKIACKISGDRGGEIFAKLILNGSYGKFGQNPEHYYDYIFSDRSPNKFDEDLDKENKSESVWRLFHKSPGSDSIWRKKSLSKSYYDVATAASITGAARSILIAALAAADRPIYCDTDSIICRSLNMPLSETVLGSWKVEGKGNICAVAGKKLYAMRDTRRLDIVDEKLYKLGNREDTVKIASKGAILNDNQIFDICKGGVANWENQAPSFSLNKRGTTFVKRRIKLK